MRKFRQTTYNNAFLEKRNIIWWNFKTGNRKVSFNKRKNTTPIRKLNASLILSKR